MKTPSPQQSRGARARPAFRLRPVALSCAALLIGATDLALAQQAEQQVTVTGIRRAVESAIAIKKEADSIVEAVTSEDIGKCGGAAQQGQRQGPEHQRARHVARLQRRPAQRPRGGLVG